MASNILTYISDNIDESYTMIAGCVGAGMAVEFRTWCNLYHTLPEIEGIFDGKETAVPESTDVMYMLVNGMGFIAHKHKNDMQKMANSIRYAQKLPPDFSMILLKGYMALEEGYTKKLVQIPEYSAWLSKIGKYLNHD
jgi:hypothetical protein